MDADLNALNIPLPFLINTREGVAVDALMVLNNEAAKSAASH
jgi:acetyltransferase